MSTLITGVGLVGTAFAQRALQRGEKIVFFDMAPKMDFLQRKLGNADVTVLKRDIRDLPALIDAMQTHKVDTVLHTAGLIGGAVANPVYSGLQINVMGTVNVAEAVRLTGVKRLIQISTMGVYNRRMEGDDPIEEGFYRGDGNAYGNSKVAKELMVEAYQRLYGFELIVLRLANVFGLGHFAGGSAGGEMLQNLVEAGVKGGVANIPQESTRDFEYVYFKDVGRAIELAATIPTPAETTFNIGTGIVITFDDLVAMVQGLLPKLEVEILPGKPPRSSKQPMVTTRAKEMLGWEPEYSVEDGFKAYIEDMKSALSS